MNWFIIAIKRHHDFMGRSRRKEFWYFTLFNLLCLSFFILLDHALSFTYIGKWYGLLSTIYVIIAIKPTLAVTIRRLHDTRRSGYMLTLLFLPIFGHAWLIFLFCLDSNPRLNIYGENPKQEELL